MANTPFTTIENGSYQLRYEAIIPRDANNSSAFGGLAIFDDRSRNSNGYVELAPKKIVPDLDGSGEEVSENYPLEESESNIPRRARGISLDESTPHSFSIAALGVEGKQENLTVTFPSDPFGAIYPYNSVRETESGHLFESDDTPSRERIKESHRIGTYYEVYPDGTKVTRIVGDEFELTVKDKSVHIQGSCFVTVDGDCNLYTKGNLTQQVDGDYNLWVKGRHNIKVDGDSNFVCGGTYDENITGKKTAKIGGDHQHVVAGNEVIVVGEQKTSVLNLSGNRTVAILGNENRIIGINTTTTAVGNYSIQATNYNLASVLGITQTATVFMNLNCGAPVAGSSISMTTATIFQDTSGLHKRTGQAIVDSAQTISLN